VPGASTCVSVCQRGTTQLDRHGVAHTSKTCITSWPWSLMTLTPILPVSGFGKGAHGGVDGGKGVFADVGPQRRLQLGEGVVAAGHVAVAREERLPEDGVEHSQRYVAGVAGADLVGRRVVHGDGADLDPLRRARGRVRGDVRISMAVSPSTVNRVPLPVCFSSSSSPGRCSSAPAGRQPPKVALGC